MLVWCTTDRDVDGVVEMMLDATQNYNEPLNEERIYSDGMLHYSQQVGVACKG